MTQQLDLKLIRERAEALCDLDNITVAEYAKRYNSYIKVAGIEAVLALLSRLEQAEQALGAAERQIAARTGETAAERIWRNRAEQAEQQVQAVLRLADDWETGALRWEDPLRVPEEVFLIREALQQPTHKPDWTDYQLGDPGASCSCGYNGPYKECWQERRALDGEQDG